VTKCEFLYTILGEADVKPEREEAKLRAKLEEL
jgi:hypothetical protein